MHNPLNNPKLAKAKGKVVDQSGPRSCKCGRMISANKKQCAKCAEAA